MKDYVIITDSTSDLPNDFAVVNNLVVIPLTFTIEGKEYKNYLDNRELASSDFYNMMTQGKQPITSQVNSVEFVDYFTPYLKKNLDILYVAFSSGLSGTFNSAHLAKEELEEIYPDRKIILVDSKLASLGEGLLVNFAIKNKQNNFSIEENAKNLEIMKTKISSWFTINSIDTLKRGGRVSNSKALIAKALSIKPILFVDENGKLVASTKARGRKHSIAALVTELEKRFIKDETNLVYISHANCYDEALILKQLIEEKTGIKEFLISEIGPVIGAHTGPGCLTVFFIGSSK